MSSLNDPITVSATIKTVKFDEGECILTVRIPASDAIQAARFAIMHQVVFDAVFTPVDAKSEPRL